MNILIAGGTGFIGKALTKKLRKQGHHVYILTRTPEKFHNTNQTTYLTYGSENIPDLQVVINLAGDSLFGYWTKAKKSKILNSRLETTKRLVQMMKNMKLKPDVFISSSAVGFYGTSEETIFTEKTTKHGDDFLADVVVKWEQAANKARTFGIRTVNIRFGVVLGASGGALPMMRFPVKLFLGGKIGTGEQWLSWIHITDAVRLIIFTINNQQILGPINLTAPLPVRNKVFIKELANIIKRPSFLPIPATIVKIVTGEMNILITQGQYAIPQKALDNNFTFIYPNLLDALKEIHSN